ncbi:DUF5908 family protein [Pandoraea commovens]|uniref:DUF5908 family protein n=1 Tax=Pandoraea commovens TaxID=2508289 RepID=A0A5E4RPI1_9BURK|nr:DUF5908 family protein [Pandoraea commovens]UVA77254.1 DUF5908 family protein [Pandoraea commovens]VVD65296.1 hypothetical protein PCO31010_00321 [Pandoraea commovens]
MPIEIGHLSIKSTVVQRASDTVGALTTPIDEPGVSRSFDEQARADLLAECRSLVLDLLERAKER